MKVAKEHMDFALENTLQRNSRANLANASIEKAMTTCLLFPKEKLAAISLRCLEESGTSINRQIYLEDEENECKPTY